MSFQNWLAEKLSRITTEPPATKTAPISHNSADAVIHRQAIVQAIARAGFHHSCKPMAPLHQPGVADIGSFRQSGGPGRVDVQRARSSMVTGGRSTAKLFQPSTLDLEVKTIKSGVADPKTQIFGMWAEPGSAEVN